MYRLKCIDWNLRHTKFVLFDTKGANCGTICIESEDLANFVGNWDGSIDYDDKLPPALELALR